MTVDLQARAKLAESTRWLIGGRITNYQFDDAIPKSDDPAVQKLYSQFLWLLYCDLHEYHLSGPDKLSSIDRDTAIRCILLLKSGLPYPWPVLSRLKSVLLTLGNLLTLGFAGRIYFRRIRALGDMTYWPFLTASQYTDALGTTTCLSGADANDSLQRKSHHDSA